MGLSGDLHLARGNLAESTRRERERLHDARTVIFSLMGASRQLSRPESAFGVDPDRLHGMMNAELRRLGTLLDPEAGGPMRPFRIADVLDPLVLAHRLTGAAIQANFDDSCALGRPEATATAVANLLANARAHAPGAGITVTATSRGTTAFIRVEDDGPGFPIGERLLDAGVRGSTARGDGSGLGLHTAARAMTQQGGSLQLTSRSGGGTCVTLSLCSSRAR